MAGTHMDARARRIAEAVTGLVDEGECLVITAGKLGAVQVRDATATGGPTSPLRDSHPELYGMLLWASFSIARPGNRITRLIWAATAVYASLAAVGLAPVPHPALRSIWGLGILLVTAPILGAVASAVLRGLR